jgi:predicted PurR-regulated permease PerM
MNEAVGMEMAAVAVVLVSVVIAIVITYFMLKNSDRIVNRIGQQGRSIRRDLEKAIRYGVNNLFLRFIFDRHFPRLDG